mmetsp:Transcript_28469/g.44787  ORF Transcript_28469/g.44787 Transcript_28469/m.44787 type:complete len:92 (+) Transcript_28469:1-276(+)
MAECIIPFFITYIGTCYGGTKDPDGVLANAADQLYRARPVRRCAAPGCGAKGENLRACAGCREVFYCSEPCQRTDWRTGGHKHRCTGRAGR